MPEFVSNFGTLLKIKIVQTYTAIKGVFDVPAINNTQGKIEVTHHDQNSPYRKYIPSGLIDTNDYEFQMRSKRSDATQQALYTAYKAGTLCDFELEHTDGLTQQFQAYVIGMTYNEADATNPDAVNITVSLAISGDITETEESI